MRHGSRSQKKLDDTLAEEEARQPGRPVTLFCTDEHRIGLKPVTRRVWAPRGHRPTALGHHRYQWLYVTAFVAPATGESHWYVGNGVSTPAVRPGPPSRIKRYRPFGAVKSAGSALNELSLDDALP